MAEENMGAPAATGGTTANAPANAPASTNPSSGGNMPPVGDKTGTTGNAGINEFEKLFNGGGTGGDGGQQVSGGGGSAEAQKPAGQDTGGDEKGKDGENAGKDNAAEKKDGEGQDAAADWDALLETLNKAEGVDRDLTASFVNFARENKLTPDLAGKLAKWQEAEIERMRLRLVDEGLDELRREWGQRANANQQKALTLIAQVDRALGEGHLFSQALDACGASCNKNVIRGLYRIAEMLSEDALGHGVDGSNGEKQETALQALSKMFK